MLSCKEVATTLASGELEVSGVRGRMEVWLHLALCTYCRAYARQLRLLGEVTRRLMGRETADPAALTLLEERLAERCRTSRERPEAASDSDA